MSASAGPPSRRGALGRELLFALDVLGPTTSAELARAIGRSEPGVRAALASLRDDGLVRSPEARPEAVALTPAGREEARGARREEAEALGALAAGLYPRFAELNRRVKRALTRWQLRTIGGVEVPNDHRDPAHDAAALGALGDAAAELAGLLGGLASRRPRYRAYPERLERALEGARSGRRDLVCGVAVDSFHGIWWQLHADLLALLGRERGEEDA